MGSTSNTSGNVDNAAKNTNIPLIFGAHKSFVRLRITPLLKLERILYLVNENIQSIDIRFRVCFTLLAGDHVVLDAGDGYFVAFSRNSLASRCN